MGSFDSFFIDTQCPYCGVFLRAEFQTKILGEGLDAWTINQEFEMEGLQIDHGKIKGCLAICKQCHEFFRGDVVIQNRIVKGIENVTKEKEGNQNE